jgi:Tol biopolymer transport system component
LRDSSGIAYQKGDDIFVRLLADFDQEIPLLTSEGVQEWTPAISPDGTKLCFSSNQGLGVSPAAALFVTPFSIDRLLIKGFQVAGSTFFTPDGDGTNDVVTVDYQLATDAAVTAKVYASDGNLTRKLLLEARQRAGTNQFVWDGLDEQRRLAKDGIYHLTLDARDSFGNVSFPQIVRVNLAKSFGSLPIGVPSHDGSKFIQGGNERIVIRNLDGTETTVLSLPEKGLRQSERREFDWSPDERQICFVARPSSGAVSEQIYVVNMDRSDRIPLPLTHPDDDGTGNARSVAPAWSPTGKEIAYVSWYIRGTAPDKYLAKNIAVMNSDGTGKRNLTSYGRDNALGYGTVPSWTGDGVNVLYSAREGGEAVQDDIWMVNHNGGQPVQLTDHPFTDIWPFGTIDAGQLIWTSSRQTSLQGSFDLWIQNLDGSAKWALWKNGGGPAVRVSSDGSLIYSGTGAGVIELFQSVTKGRVVGTVAEDEIGKQTKAVAGALVTAYQGSVEIASAVSDLDGTFELLNLAPGTYRLAASRAGYLTVETSLSGVAANASIQLGSPLKTTRLPKARIAKPPVPLRVNRSATLTAELLTRNVQRVDFEWRPKGQQSWASLGSGTAEPFTLTVDVSGRAVGNEETYEARAVARNTDLGLSDDSPETAEIVIDHRSPSSVIVSPTPNQVLPAAAICILQATSHDPDSTGAVFQYRQAGSLTWSDIGSAQGTGFYSLAFNTSQLKVGTTYSLRAVAYDAAGNSDPTPVPVNFSVVEPSASIRLIVSRTAGGVSISWPNSATGFVLEVTDDLNNPNWVPVTGVANNSVTVTISGATKFYRLRR